MTLLPLIVLGFFLGMRHATDPDHVVAVTTIVAREKRISVAALVGLMWGVGHTVTILIVGGAIILFGIVIPPRVGLTMEFSVAVMLILLGALNLSGVLKRVDEIAHRHEKPSDPPFEGARFALAKPLVVGLVHGLAGSAAVALLVLAAVHDALAAVAYLALFGVGTMAGMMLMTSALALPFAATANRFSNLNRWMAQATGVVSVLFGLFMAYEIGIHDGLFSGHPVWNAR